MIEPQQHSRSVHLLAAGAAAQPPSRPLPVLTFVVVTYLLGMLVLSPVQFFALPSNLAPVDFWNLILLPVCWLYLIRIRQAVRLPYFFGMWFILLGSFIGTFSASDSLASIMIVIKEAYLYVWCVTLAAVFASLEPSLLRRSLLVWTAVVVLHGVVLVAEFLSPNIFGFMVTYLGSFGEVDTYRPSGLFQDPNLAAFFQLMGFVPLLLGGLPRKLTSLLGMFLLLSIIVTGSFSALAGLLGASAVAVIALLLMGGHLKVFVWLATVVTFAAGLFYFTLRQYPDYQVRLERITFGRVERSAEVRLNLWQTGSDVLLSETPIWGLGPGNYRDLLVGKTLHNDLFAFAMERGVIGLLGLVLFAVGALSSAVNILLIQNKFRGAARPAVVIFLAVLFGALIESQTQQIFHQRALWLVLALQEATLFRMMFPSIEAAAARRVELWGERLQSPEKSSPSSP